MQYYFTGFIVIFFLVCYGYSYVIVKLAKDRGEAHIGAEVQDAVDKHRQEKQQEKERQQESEEWRG